MAWIFDMKKKYTFYICMIFSLLTLFLGGCGGETVPDPPAVKQLIVLETFTALEQRQHIIAMNKISRLRELDPTNVFLANFEVLERNNSIINATQAKIDENDLKKALEVVSTGILKYGRHDDLMDVQKKLKIITRIEELLTIFRAPQDSDQLNSAAIQLKKIGEVYKPASIFLQLAKNKIAEAEIMHEWEINRAVIDLVSQIDDMQKSEDSDVPLLYAILENVAPTHPVLLKYLEYLNGDKDVDLTIYPEENIFATADENDEDEKEVSDDSSPTIKQEKDEEETKEEKKGGWWNKFSF